MTARDKPIPPPADPKPGRHPGYPEPQPRDGDDARKSGPTPPANPDEGGLDRDPGQDGTHDGD